MDELAAELVEDFQVASFQQRGLAPSMVGGPFTIEQALNDIVSVLDHLGWSRAYLVGHSWGGHLAIHAGVALPERLLGVLAVDPLGAVGDGGAAAFEAEMWARMPEVDRVRAQALDTLLSEGDSSESDALEHLRLVWPSYFADPEHAPPMPPMHISLPAQALFSEIVAALPGLEASLPRVAVPVGVLVGARSPMPPQEAGAGSAARIPGAWAVEVPDAGHFPWLEAPGCVKAAMSRLHADRSSPSGADNEALPPRDEP
jgi:pimeloyl-ACP methyl ester carboxylesterase